MKDYKDMIKFFEGVKAQHKGLKLSGMNNPHSEAIIKTYDFVIGKLKEWMAREVCGLILPLTQKSQNLAELMNNAKR